MSSSTSFLQIIKTRFTKACLEAYLLLQRLGSNPQNQNDGSIQGASTDSSITSIPFLAVVLVAMAGVVSSLVTLTSTRTWLVVLAGIMTLLLSPYLILQKHALANLGHERRRHEGLKHRVHDLRVSNQLLNQSMETLEQQEQILGHVEGDLSQLADETGVDKDHLIRLVEETGRLEKTIRKQLQAQIMQQVMTTVISASGATNQDFTLKDHDVQLLQSRLASVSPQHQPDVTNFRQLLQRQLQQNGSGEMTLPQVMKLLRNLVKDSANTK